MKEEGKNFTVKLDNEKLKQALEVLEDAVRLGNHVTYASGIEYECKYNSVRVSDIDGDSIRIPIEYVPVVARNLLRVYFDVIEQYREAAKKLETGVWE